MNPVPKRGLKPGPGRQSWVNRRRWASPARDGWNEATKKAAAELPQATSFFLSGFRF
jgi:hypothetical protein